MAEDPTPSSSLADPVRAPNAWERSVRRRLEEIAVDLSLRNQHYVTMSMMVREHRENMVAASKALACLAVLEQLLIEVQAHAGIE